MTQQGGLVWQCGLLCPAQTPEPRTDKLLATKEPAYGSSATHTETHRPAFHRPETDKTPILCPTRRGGSEPPQRTGRSTEERWGGVGRRGKGHVHTSLSHLPPSFPARVPHKEITAFTITPNLSASSPYQALTYLKHLVSFCHLPSCRARSKLLESTRLCGSPTWPQHTDNIFVSRVSWSSPVAPAHKRQKAGGSAGPRPAWESTAISCLESKTQKKAYVSH